MPAGPSGRRFDLDRIAYASMRVAKAPRHRDDIH
ncbi:hypothetical protein chiPu_0029600, partial [Chiloscyllium punctatum]|nr:hypothetical protein [Chiloscyllium punctatum]